MSENLEIKSLFGEGENTKKEETPVKRKTIKELVEASDKFYSNENNRKIQSVVDIVSLIFRDNIEPKKHTTGGLSKESIRYVIVSKLEVKGLDRSFAKIEFGKESSNAPRRELVEILANLSDEDFENLKIVLKDEGLTAVRGETETLFFVEGYEEAAAQLNLN